MCLKNMIGLKMRGKLRSESLGSLLMKNVECHSEFMLAKITNIFKMLSLLSFVIVVNSSFERQEAKKRVYFENR